MGETANAEFEMIRKDGSQIAAEIDGKVGYDNEGNFQQTHCIVRDVTQRKQAEHVLARAANEWRTTFDSTQDAIMLLDTDHRVLRANRAAAEFAGVPVDALVGKKCHEVVHDLDAPPDFCPFQELKRTKQRVQLETQLANGGRWLAITMDPVLDEAGNINRAVLVATDITERKQAER